MNSQLCKPARSSQPLHGRRTTVGKIRNVMCWHILLKQTALRRSLTSWTWAIFGFGLPNNSTENVPKLWIWSFRNSNRCFEYDNTAFRSGTLATLWKSKGFVSNKIFLFRWAALKYPGRLVLNLHKVASTPQMQYQIIFCLWLLTFETEIAKHINT